MKLSITYFPEDLEHPTVHALIGDRIASRECLWGSDLAEEYLRVFSSLSGCSVRLSFSFTEKQCETYSHFILRPRHLITEADSVHKANSEHIAQQPVHHEDKFGCYRLRNCFYVANMKPLSNRVWSLESSGGYLIAETLLTEMMDRFTGLYDMPVLHFKTQQPIQGWRALGSSTWLNALCLDDSVETPLATDGKKRLNPLGLLSAHEVDLQNLPDISRLPSATTSGDSEYIASQSAWQYLRKNDVKSFRPEPLLNVDSPQYQQYRELLDEVRSRLAVNRNNRLRM